MKELFETLNIEASKEMFMVVCNTPSSNYLCFIPLTLKDELKKSDGKLYDFLVRSDYVLENGRLIKSKQPSIMDMATEFRGSR